MAKKKKQSTQKPHIALAVVSVLVIAVLLVVAVRLFDGYREKRMFMSLQSDMKALQADFNAIDEGWEYDANCRGEGGKYTQDKPSSCNLRLVNSSLGQDQSSSFEQYKAILSLNEEIKVEGYKRSYDVEVQDGEKLKGMASTFYPSYITNPNCELIIYDRTGKVSGAVTCTVSASKFYFPRNDL